jgi:VWFA-related protein
MRSTFSLCLLVALLQAAPPPAQPARPPAQPPVTFRAEVNYVEIDANVVDAQGNFVRTLTRDDFQITEDGKPQALTAFSMVDIPVERADPPLFAKNPIVPDVTSNRTPFEGRIFVMVIDDLHTKFGRTHRTRQAARQFVERYVGANDMVAVVNTSGSGKGMQDFTPNRALALRAIDSAMGWKEGSSTEAALQDYATNRDMPGMASDINARFNDQMRYNNARNSMRTLKNIADYMAGMRGRRKALVLFSEGVNYDISNPINNMYASDVQREIKDVIASATRANVSIYSVDPRGVTTGMEDAIEISGFPSDGSISPTRLMDEMRYEHDSLRVLSDETGGFAVLNQNDFRTGFSRILEENSGYYVLGYYPTNDKRDGRFRNVEVKVSKPGLRVRSRRGYVAPSSTKKEITAVAPEGTSKELRDAMESPIPISGLTLTTFAAPFKGDGNKVSIAMAIEVDGAGFTFKQTPTGLYNDDLELTLFAADTKDGKIKDGVRDVIKLDLKPDTYNSVRQGAFRIIRRIQVPPGTYHMRVGARETGGGKAGTVVFELEVPDYNKAPLGMSGIAIASAWASRVPTAVPDPKANEFKDVLPSPPSAAREFPKNDTLSVFAEIYDNETKTPHRVDITATILADDGKVVQTRADERKSEELQGTAGGYGYTTQFPLTGLAPGRYVLRVSAKSRLGDSPAITREVEFRVR